MVTPFIAPVLCYRWVPACGQLFRVHKESWSHLIPINPEERAVLAKHFFNTACSLMARQLRECVEASLNEYVGFLELYKVDKKGN